MFSSMVWSDVHTPLIIGTWLFFIILARIIFHKFEELSKTFPESALLIVLGLVAGFIFDYIWVLDIHLHPELFFLYLLPPIALDAGYFLPNKAFFDNIGTILLYAGLGTVLNIILIAGAIYAFNPFYNESFETIDICLFATLISAVDPVAVLSVFEEIHVNQLLYICVFGESLLNDAVVIVLYHSLASMAKIGTRNLIPEDFIHAALSFVMVASGGVIIGMVWVCITALATKFSFDIPMLQPLICLTFPYLAYLISESVHLSGIIAIVTCGLLMKNYISGNLNEKALTTVKFFLKTLSSCCEAIIFVFLGLSIFSKQHSWDLLLAAVTVTASIIGRFIVVLALTYFANQKRVHKIGMMDQMIMGYGGLRGAICYGLVMTLDGNDIPYKDTFVTTTVIVIAVTVFIQGTTIKPLVKLLGVKTEIPTPKTVTQQIVNHSGDDMMTGIEAIIGMKGPNYWRRRLSDFNQQYVQPTFMRSPTSRGERLIEKYSAVSAEEQRLNCEAIIFVFLGLSIFSKQHSWDLLLAAVTVTASIIGRFIVVLALTYFANQKRVHKIGMMDQMIMGYGGLRGAICYGLVMTLDGNDIPYKDTFVTTTVIVIAVTVFIQGTTLKPLVKLLGVKTEIPTPKTVTQQIVNHSGDDMMTGIEAIIGMKGPNYWRRRLSDFNQQYVQPTFMRSPTSRGERLIEKYSAVSAEEQRLKLLERYGV